MLDIGSKQKEVRSSYSSSYTFFCNNSSNSSYNFSFSSSYVSFLLPCLIFIALLCISTSGVNRAFCCTSSPNSTAYCVEFNTELEAYNNGCDEDAVVEADCDSTQCGNTGCCESDCSSTTKSECFEGAFDDFMSCTQVSSCKITCCVIGGVSYEGYGQGDWAQYCSNQGGTYYGTTCTEIANPASGSYGRIYGYVKNPSGTALSGATVVAGTLSQTTDGNGYYNFAQLPISYPNSYTIYAYLANYQQDNYPTVVVSANSQTQVSDIKLVSTTQAYVTIMGRVTDAYGNGISTATVSINGSQNTYTDVSGYYTLRKQIAAGTYTVRASKSGYNAQSLSMAVTPGLKYQGINFQLTSSSTGSTNCNNGALDSGEECDGDLDDSCPGECQADCTCPLTCTEKGYYCADLSYQCDNVNGNEQTSYSDDCETSYNSAAGGGVCCDRQVTSLPTCISGHSAPDASIYYTDVVGTGGTYCKCGNYIVDTTTATSKYCCYTSSGYNVSTTRCSAAGGIKGLVTSSSSPLGNVSIQLSGIYQTTSNSSSGTNYRINSVAPGTYTLTASKTGYNDYSASVTISSGTNTTYNIAMTRSSGLTANMTLTLSAVRGYPYIKITVSNPDTSALTHYVIYRNGQQIYRAPSSEISSAYVYTDYQTSWSTSYNYTVSSFSNSILIDTDTASLSTGNSACSGIFSSNEFCGSSSCYSAKSSSYCGLADSPPFTYRLKCTENNFLQYADGTSAGSVCSDTCIESGNGATTCGGNDTCEDLGLWPYISSYTSTSANIFGFYYSQAYSSENCTQTSSGTYKFCYYDYFYSNVLDRDQGSYTTVDQCISCESDGFCNTYQSERACLEDHCHYGRHYNTTCKWNDTFSQIGRGICYSDDVTSTTFCGMCSTSNPVFYNTNCTQSVCNLLGYCIAASDKSSCSACTLSSPCSSFNSNEAGCIGSSSGYAFTGYPQLSGMTCNSSTSISYGDDSCGIEFCRYLTTSCIKDANYDGLEDCNNSDSSCVQDRTIPSTLMTSQKHISTVDNSLSFTSSSGASIYYCISDVGAYCCPNKVVSSTVEFPNNDYDFSNMETTKTLWYYGSSSYGIPEPIKNLSLKIDTQAPQLTVTYTVTNSTISLLQSDIKITISTSETAISCADTLTGSTSSSQMSNATITTTSSKTVTFPSLYDGSYIYSLSCTDLYGNVNDSVTVNIDVDRIKLIKNPQPNYVTLAYSLINFSVETLDRQYYCYYSMTSPSSSSEAAYDEVSASSGSYVYYSRNNELDDSETYQYDINCYDTEEKTSIADSSSIIFTIDKIAPVSRAYVYNEGVYDLIVSGEYYNYPSLKINCSDTAEGPPYEFGCSQMKYCVKKDTSCSVSTGSTVTSSSYIFTPATITSTGKYYLCMQANDAGGNEETSHCYYFYIDLSEPTVTITQPADEQVLCSQSMTITGTWSDAERPDIITGLITNNRGFQMSLNDISISGETTTGGYSGLATLNDLFAGANVLKILAIDSSNNYGTISKDFYYDLFPPNITSEEIYGERLGSPGTVYIPGVDGSATTIYAALQWNLLVSGNSTYYSHEYGNKLRFVLGANDYMYLDQSSRWGTDVKANVTITKIGSSASTSTSYTSALSYNESSGKYNGLFTTLLDLGNYSIVYTATENQSTGCTQRTSNYTQYLYVNDTQAPYFSIVLKASNGSNVSEVMYGTYNVEITPSEPIRTLYYLNYTVNGKMKYVQLTTSNGTNMTGVFTLSQTDPDLSNLNNAAATFSIYGQDTHGLNGSTIISGGTFYITTTGPLSPVILTPYVTTSALTFYSNSTNYTIEGIVYKTGTTGLRSGQVILQKNVISSSLADNHWTNAGNATTYANSYNRTWPSSMGSITLKANDTINLNLNGYADVFVAGRYVEFQNHKRQNRQLYRIKSVTPTETTVSASSVLLYDVQFETNLIGFAGINIDESFTDSLTVYNLNAPDGWFAKNVSLQQGNNYFLAYAKDGSNEGAYTSVFNIIYDTTQPSIVNVSPADGTRTGDTNVPIYAYVNPTGSNVSQYSMTVNGTAVATTLTYDNQGYAQILYTHGTLAQANYTANIIVMDMANNTLNHQWRFEIDPSAPLTPSIAPSGTINNETPKLMINFSQEVALDDATLRFSSGSYNLNFTTLASTTDNMKYSYQIPSSNKLTEQGVYTISVKARKKVDSTYGSQGIFSQQFTFDNVPPTITQITDTVSGETLPVFITAQTNEVATCRYGLTDTTYDNMPYSSTIPAYTTSHTLSVYSLTSLASSVYVRCMDQAGNKMTSSRRVNITVGSLLYPPPAIYDPAFYTVVSTDSTYTLIGSTFNETDPIQWIPSVNLIISKSRYFYTNDVEFDNRYYTQSLPIANVSVVNPSSNFIFDSSDNSIQIVDTTGAFVKDKYVEFPNNRKSNYMLYLIKSVASVSADTPNTVEVSFYDTLPDALDTSQDVYVYDQEAPAGWFDYSVNLDEGNNFIYASARNNYGEGSRTSVYNIVKDLTDPSLYNEFPHNGEVIAEETLDVYIYANGTGSNITSAEFVFDGLPVAPEISFIKDYKFKILYSTTGGNGLHTTYVKAYDAVGRDADKEWSFTIDTNVPLRPSITPNTYINDSTPLLDIQFQDRVNLQSLRLVGNNFINDFTNTAAKSENKHFTYTVANALAEGEYKTEVRAAIYGSDNSSIGFWYEKFVVDLTPPVITSIPSTIKTTEIPVNFLMLTNEEAKCRFSEVDQGYYQMENELDTDYVQYHYSSAQTSGSRATIYIRCRDIAGNVMTSSKAITINGGGSVVLNSEICGDGTITGTEECDGTNWGSITGCSSYNSDFSGGNLTCGSDSCIFNTSQCTGEVESCVNNSDCGENQICLDGICYEQHCYNGIRDSTSGELGVDCGGECALCPEHCSNGVEDQDETGIDCGGSSCTACASHCSNGVMDNDELGIDCGGSSCTACASHCSNGVMDSSETGIDCGGNDCSSCSIVDHCDNGVKDMDEDNIDCGGELCDACATCGNGIVEAGETCDGADFGRVRDCGSLPGFVSGVLTCNQQICHFDTSRCVKQAATCGNGIVEQGEQCDSTLGGKTCSDFGFTGGTAGASGTLSCNNCTFNTSACTGTSGTCGDGILNKGEQCDTSNYIFSNCAAFNGIFTSGSLGCTRCIYDTTQCIARSSCNNGIFDAGEECDSGIKNATCRLFDSFSGGTLTCTNSCWYNTSQCIIAQPECGDGLLDAGENCDYGIAVTARCSQFDSYVDAYSGNVTCNTQCRYVLAACKRSPGTVTPVLYCGNNQVDPSLGEQCEAGIITKSCQDLGLNGTGYPSCYANASAHPCQYDVTNCVCEGAGCGTTICSSGETELCNNLNALYVDGIATCLGDGFYNMSLCWSTEYPVISPTELGTVRKQYVNLTGNVSKAKRLEIYVNGVLQANKSYAMQQQYAFEFRNIFLARSTEVSNGINEIQYIAYGAFSNINTSYTFYITYDPLGPAIQIMEPANLKATNATPLIKINTSKASACSISYMSFSTSYSQNFTTLTGFVHQTVLSHPLLEDQYNSFVIKCTDTLGNEQTYENSIYIDTTRPVITGVELVIPDQLVISSNSTYKYMLIYSVLNSTLRATVDSLSRCRYGIDTTIFSMMTDYDSSISSYLEQWVSDSVSSSKTELSIYTICVDEAGLYSDPYQLKIDVDADAPLQVNTSLMGQYVNTSTPIIKVSTNRLANCTLTYQGTSKSMTRGVSAIGTSYIFELGVSAFNIALVNDRQYSFDVECRVSNAVIAPVSKTITIIADLVAPKVDILYPHNNDIFNVQRVSIQVQTEQMSTLSLYLNNTLQSEQYTDSGSVTFDVLLHESVNQITVVAVDKADNRNNSGITLYFIGSQRYPYVTNTYPRDGAQLQSVLNKTLIAYVWTVYGANLSMDNSNIVLENKYGVKINGVVEFRNGSITNQIGNFTFRFNDALDDGNYTWTVSLEDEFGQKGTDLTSTFSIIKTKPIITLMSPVSSSSDGEQDDVYTTRQQSFYLAGYIESMSTLTEASYQVDKGNGFGSAVSLMPLSNGVFNKTITLDQLGTGTTRTYVYLLKAKNTDGQESTLRFSVLHDLQAPLLLEVNIE